jgi:hypothetical protein
MCRVSASTLYKTEKFNSSVFIFETHEIRDLKVNTKPTIFQIENIVRKNFEKMFF